MDEILRQLPPGARVLDLGSRSGSFPCDSYPVVAIRVDLERPRGGAGGNFVQADAARLPFRSGAFGAVICNHSLEHFKELGAALDEIGRVLDRQNGALYVAIPDARTITDRIYRWLARGGGHVNPFRSSAEVVDQVERSVGLRLVVLRPLCTSLSFLNRRNVTGWPPKRLLLLGGGHETILRLATYLFRVFDRIAGSRLSVYGWAFYFGNVVEEVDARVWTNVCVRCGSGHQSGWLRDSGAVVRTAFAVRYYGCPSCGARNLFTDDESYADLS